MLRLRTIAFVVVALSISALPAMAAVALSSHDFSAEGWGTTQICEPCHTPHDAKKDGSNVPITPLWNHASTAATFTPYDSDTMDANVGQPSHYSSKLCLSCHDGTVAKDSFGAQTGTDFMLSTDPGYVGTDLRTEHPIGFLYADSILTDDELHPASYTVSEGGTLSAYYLFGGYVGCASCHDVHNTTTYPDMLRADPDASIICLDCHIK